MNPFTPNSELVAQEREASRLQGIASDPEASELKSYNISGYIDSCWERAKQAKEQGAEPRILANMRQYEGQYDPAKLAAIKQIGGSEVFMMITDAKCKNAFNWVSDILFQPGQKSWGIEPTPVPELSEEIKAEIVNEAFAPLAEEFMMQVMQSGQEVDPNMINQFLDSNMPLIEKNIREEILAKARELGKEAEVRVDDKLVEGGWYRALRDCLHNIVNHTGFIKGPILKRRKVMKIKPDPQTGKLTPIMTEELYPCYESRNPLFIYPAPDSTGINDGYLIDRVKLTPMALQELIGIPGYNDDAIYSVLEELKSGKLKEWINVDQEVSSIHDELSPLLHDSDKVDCLEFWGAVQGEKLIDWGISVDHEGSPIDHLLFYNVRAYKISRHIIGILFNTHPMGHKPFYKTSFENRDGAFWGKGLPEVISDVQTICNACARAIVNNVGISSGPMIERNIDRIPASMREDKHIIPWKVWDVTETMMSGAPALTFYQPRAITDQLINVYNNFSKIADEHSGIPAYAHGDPNVGGAGNTASGLNMLMGGAARGIRAIVSSIDEDIIKPSVEAQYFWSISQQDNKGFICDYQIITSGSSAALLKEQMGQRRIEFMRETANPIDMQILGMEGRKYLLEETARSIQLELSRVFPIRQDPNIPPLEPQAPGQGNATLDAAGNPVSGQDNAQFTPQRTSGAPQPQPRAGGGPVNPGQNSYLVGEEGPEIFVPSQSGTIIPNPGTVARGGAAPNPMAPTPQPGPSTIIDPWGDEITPGIKPKLWGNLPIDQRAEDVMQVLSGNRSMGTKKDEAFKQFFQASGRDIVKTAEALSESMEMGHLPHFFMYETDKNTPVNYQKAPPAASPTPRAGGGPVEGNYSYDQYGGNPLWDRGSLQNNNLWGQQPFPADTPWGAYPNKPYSALGMQQPMGVTNPGLGNMGSNMGNAGNVGGLGGLQGMQSAPTVPKKGPLTWGPLQPRSPMPGPPIVPGTKGPLQPRSPMPGPPIVPDTKGPLQPRNAIPRAEGGPVEGNDLYMGQDYGYDSGYDNSGGGYDQGYGGYDNYMGQDGGMTQGFDPRDPFNVNPQMDEMGDMGNLGDMQQYAQAPRMQMPSTPLSDQIDNRPIRGVIPAAAPPPPTWVDRAKAAAANATTVFNLPSRRNAEIDYYSGEPRKKL